jgi:2'-5' RNA ligase
MTRNFPDARKARCFLALTFSREDLAPAVDLIQRLRSGLGDRKVKWVSPDNLHLTLYFFGDLNRGRLIQAKRVVESLSGAWEPVPVAWDIVGCFPSRRRVQVIWLGLRDSGESLSKLSRKAHGRLQEADFPPPDKPFRAHLTLGRVRRGEKVHWEDLEEASGGLTVDAPPFTIRSMQLFQSTLRPQGPLYTPLVKAPCHGDEAPSKGD